MHPFSGFHFTNGFTNRFPFSYITYSRCGGISYAALDYYHAGQCIPDVEIIPARGSTLEKYVARRQLDSLLILSAAKFLGWSVYTDEIVDTRTAHEFSKLATRVPCVLGLVAARSLKDLAHNHQVVALDYDIVQDQPIVYLYDCNHPDQEVAITHEGNSWIESTGEIWRGWFVQDYIFRQPPDIGAEHE